jgi:hypothetical protein
MDLAVPGISYTKEYKRAWARNNAARITENLRRYRYGMKPGDYDKMLKRQDGCCCICRMKKKLVIDHDHETGIVRGLLCRVCNSHVGWLEKYFDTARNYAFH